VTWRTSLFAITRARRQLGSTGFRACASSCSARKTACWFRGRSATSDELTAAAIVLGARGFSRVQSVLLGSVSATVSVHASRLVLIIHGHTKKAERERSGRLRDRAPRHGDHRMPMMWIALLP
jgi:hypothetical protein